MLFIEREDSNPLITPLDVPPTSKKLKVVGVFNAAATRFNGAELLLLLRVAETALERRTGRLPVLAARSEDGRYKVHVHFIRKNDPKYNTKTPHIVWSREGMRLTHISHLRLARSEDGVHFAVDPHPTIIPEGEMEEGGIEDPRITRIGDTFYITYTAVSPHGAAGALMSTTDFRKFKRHGIIFPPPNKDVVLFPEKIRGHYVALNRPMKMYGAFEMWIARSKDLVSWSGHEVLMSPRESKWDCDRVGGGATPIRTPQGWLIIYHGVSERYGYALGAALLDLEDPRKVLARSARPILVADKLYEQKGYVCGVVFSCGAIASADGRLNIYYGGADSVTCLARTTIRELLYHLGH